VALAAPGITTAINLEQHLLRPGVTAAYIPEWNLLRPENR